MSKQHCKGYMRERAAAVLKGANGHSIRQVAEVGCVQRREWETVAKWVPDQHTSTTAPPTTTGIHFCDVVFAPVASIFAPRKRKLFVTTYITVCRMPS